MLSVLSAAVFEQLPFRQAERLVQIWETIPSEPAVKATTSQRNVRDWQRLTTGLDAIAAYRLAEVTIVKPDGADRVTSAVVSDNFFNLLGTKFRLGRGFLPGEYSAGRNDVVVVSYSFWQAAFGGSDAIVGNEIVLDGRKTVVIGVATREFRFPYNEVQLWTPLVSMSGAAAEGHNLRSIGRLREGASIAMAQAQMEAVAATLNQLYPDQFGRGIRLAGLRDELIGNSRAMLIALVVAVIALLLIACANAAGLQLLAALSRGHELAVRLALGARIRDIHRELIAQNIIATCAGLLLALGVAKIELEPLYRFIKVQTPFLPDVHIDPAIFIMAALFAILVSFFCAYIPARRIVHNPDLQRVLRRISAGAIQAGSPLGWARGGLVIFQIATCTMLLCGTALLVVSFSALQRSGANLHAENVVTAKVSLSPITYSSRQSVQHFFEETVQHVERLPGVIDAGAISYLPLAESGFNCTFNIESRVPFAEGKAPLAELRIVAGNYFNAMTCAFWQAVCQKMIVQTRLMSF